MEQILAANISGITQALRVGVSNALYGGPACAFTTSLRLGKLQSAATIAGIECTLEVNWIFTAVTAWAMQLQGG